MLSLYPHAAKMLAHAQARIQGFRFLSRKKAALGAGRPIGEGVILGLLAIADNRSRAAFEITYGFGRLANTRAYRAPVWC